MTIWIGIAATSSITPQKHWAFNRQWNGDVVLSRRAHSRVTRNTLDAICTKPITTNEVSSIQNTTPRLDVESTNPVDEQFMVLRLDVLRYYQDAVQLNDAVCQVV